VNASDEELLAELLICWEESVEKGTELSPQELCFECDHLEDEVARRIKALKELSWLDQASSPPIDEGPASDVPRTVAGRYRLIAPSGEGGHATVWKGFDERLLRDVAVKSPKPLNSQEALLREARILARLRHPNILPVLDVVEEGDDCLIVSEWVDGGNLASIHTPVSVPTAVDLVRRIADALAYAHSQGILHRDIKPANILLTASGTPLLADFGIAASLETSKTKQGGTIWYCSPEALKGLPIDERSEVYSLGLVLLGLLTGRVPHDSHAPQPMQQEVAGAIEHAQGVPKDLRLICKKALQPDPSQRFASAQEFSDALGTSFSNPSAWRKAVSIGALLIAVLAITAGIWMTAGKKADPQEMLNAAVEELIQRNPGFDGAVTPTVRNGVVTEISLNTDKLFDLTPLRSLTQLHTVRCTGSAEGKGILSDISPLEGLRLRALYFSYNRIDDLSPLRGMPLETLHASYNPVFDLEPLSNLRRLRFLNLHTTKVTDLSPIRQCPLKELNVADTPIEDLSPIARCPITDLYCERSRLSDLSPLKGHRIGALNIEGTPVSDLGALKNLPLQWLRLDFVAERDTELLRSIPTLRTVNDQPIDEFLREHQ